MRTDDVTVLLGQGIEPLLNALREAGIRIPYQRALRWVKDGIGGVRLPAARIGGRWHTTPEAVRDFIAQTTRDALRRYAEGPPRSLGSGVRYLRALGLDQRSLQGTQNKLPATHQAFKRKRERET